MDKEANKKGTTTLGMVCDNGVVVGAERRAVMGTMIAHKVAKKLFKIDDNLVLSTAGLVGDAQILSRYLRAEVELYKIQREERIPIKSAATLMSNILNRVKFTPYYVQLIMAGIDDDGAHVYALDPAGGAIEDKYTTTGSGSPFVFGVLEDHYKDGLSIDEGIDLAIKALSIAMERDSASGNGIDISIITKKGYREILEEEINSRKKEMGI
jgi:proteasome beta subunit